MGFNSFAVIMKQDGGLLVVIFSSDILELLNKFLWIRQREDILPLIQQFKHIIFYNYNKTYKKEQNWPKKCKLYEKVSMTI